MTLFWWIDLLRSPEQPNPPPEEALILPEVIENNRTLNRSTLIIKLLSMPATQVGTKQPSFFLLCPVQF